MTLEHVSSEIQENRNGRQNLLITYKCYKSTFGRMSFLLSFPLKVGLSEVYLGPSWTSLIEFLR